MNRDLASLLIFTEGMPDFLFGPCSIDNGKTFEKITQNLGEEIYIKRENGLQTRKIYHKMRKVCTRLIT